MAIWQFDVIIQPDEPFCGLGPFHRDDSEIIRAVDAILPRRDSWSDALILWGDEAGDGIVAALDGGRIAELSARIDLRRGPDPFIPRLIDFAQSCKARFLTADGDEIPPDRARLLDAIRRSDSFRFVLDPLRFIEDLAMAKSL